MKETYCTASCIEKKRIPMPVSGGRMVGPGYTWVDEVILNSYLALIVFSLLLGIWIVY